MNDSYVYEKAKEEGLGYFVLHYTDGSEIENPKLRELHQKARAALKEYQKALREVGKGAGE